MDLKKVFTLSAVSSTESVSMEEMLDRTVDLAKDILEKAEAEKEKIYFHDYMEAMFGAPELYLECSEEFFNAVRDIDGCKEAAEAEFVSQRKATQPTSQTVDRTVVPTG